MLLDGFFSAGQGGYYLLVLVFMALLVGLYLWGSSRREKTTRADELQNTYRDMTEDKLSAVPDDQLVDAVIANLMAKLDPASSGSVPYHSTAVARPLCSIQRVAAVPRAGQRGL